ncbi:MAG: hypothetical protein ABL904_07575 [Hyphomicrobiaceae bacterium]
MAVIAAAGIAMGSVNAQAADLGGNCCADLEERVAELEATTARKGNRKVSLQIYGQVSESVLWWNDGAESNTYVQENNNIKNTLGFQGNAKITSDWSAGFKLEMQIRAYRSSAANQLSLGASNNVQIAVYNTQAIALRHAYWFLKSNTYGTLTVGRDVDAATGTSSISLVNPDGFSGPNGAGFAQGGFFLRRSGTTGNPGLSARTWQSSAWINNGDGPMPFDYAQTSGLVKYTSPFFLGQTKSSGFLFSANWGSDDAWAAALRYVEDFGTFRVAAGVGYSNWAGPDRGFCTTGASGNNADSKANAILPGTPGNDLGSSVRCDSVQASGSLLHVPTGLYVSGGYAMLNDKNSAQAALARTTGFQGGTSGRSDFWWVQGGWQAKLNSLGNTIFWGQYVDVSTGLSAANGIVSTLSGTDVLNSIGGTAIQRSASTQSWGLGVSQEISAAAMVLYAGFHNVSTELMLGSASSAARAKANPIDDMQVFYTGATIKF